MNIDRKKIIGNKFFEGFTYDEVDEIIILSDAKKLDAGDIFVHQDDYDKKNFFYYYVLLEGSVNVISHNTLLKTLEKGECFGEVSYLTGGHRTALIKAREDGTEVLQINGLSVDEQGTQELRYKLMRRVAMALAEKLQRTTEVATLQVGPTDDLDKLSAPAQPKASGGEPSPPASILTPEEQEKIYKENEAKVKLMEASDFFHDFTRQEILEILSFRYAFTKHPDEQKIVSEGDKDRSFFVIVKGSAKVMKGGALLQQLGKGDTFGEMSILHGAPRSAHVIAGHDCCTIRVDAIVLEKAGLVLQLKFHKKFSKILSARLEHANIKR